VSGGRITQPLQDSRPELMTPLIAVTPGGSISEYFILVPAPHVCSFFLEGYSFLIMKSLDCHHSLTMGLGARHVTPLSPTSLVHDTRIHIFSKYLARGYFRPGTVSVPGQYVCGDTHKQKVSACLGLACNPKVFSPSSQVHNQLCASG
jgi:hypothetical protein